MKTLSILVVDDDPVIRRLLQQRLSKENHKVTVAEDGHKATDLLYKQRFDVVLTDLMMPGDIGGIEVLEATKDLHPDTEVVLITAHSSVDTAVAAMKKGAADYLEKPVNLDELLIKIDKIANVQTILRSAQDLQQAMDVTERTASATIQDLEIKVSELQQSLDQVETILRQEDETEDARIDKALDIIAAT